MMNTIDMIKKHNAEHDRHGQYHQSILVNTEMSTIAMDNAIGRFMRAVPPSRDATRVNSALFDSRIREKRSSPGWSCRLPASTGARLRRGQHPWEGPGKCIESCALPAPDA
eukprot:gene3613-biopygen8684